jgi:hypothetical protein
MSARPGAAAEKVAGAPWRAPAVPRRGRKFGGSAEWLGCWAAGGLCLPRGYQEGQINGPKMDRLLGLRGIARCARSRARLDGNNTSTDDTRNSARSRARSDSDERNTTDEDTRDSARSRARSGNENTTDEDTQDRARLRARLNDSNERQKRDRGSTPGAAAQHRER